MTRVPAHANYDILCLVVFEVAQCQLVDDCESSNGNLVFQWVSEMPTDQSAIDMLYL